MPISDIPILSMLRERMEWHQERQQVLAENVANADTPGYHARDLAPVTANLLAERGWSPRDLAGVVVGLGPGSYTGLRVGIMSARVFAYATGCALIGIGTFSAIASQA